MSYESCAEQRSGELARNCAATITDVTERLGRALEFRVPMLRRLLQSLRRCCRPVNRDETYLAEATDLADLERRMRVIERRGAGPPFVTFNH